MISLEESMPRKSDKYLRGQDVIWSQFNDINFYVEDLGQENFYLQILKKLFPFIKINKIFPLGGKDLVIKDATKYVNNRKKVYILDLDFDEILESKKRQINLFYLERYCIENYLLENSSIVEIIKEENPTYTTSYIKSQFDFKLFYEQGLNMFIDLSCHFLLIKQFDLQEDFLKIETHRDCSLESIPFEIKSNIIQNYVNRVKHAFESKHHRKKYSSQIYKTRKYFRNVRRGIKNIPGKYWINFLKVFLKKKFRFSQCSLDTFKYRLAKNCEFRELAGLQSSIINYTSGV